MKIKRRLTKPALVLLTLAPFIFGLLNMLLIRLLPQTADFSQYAFTILLFNYMAFLGRSFAREYRRFYVAIPIASAAGILSAALYAIFASGSDSVAASLLFSYSFGFYAMSLSLLGALPLSPAVTYTISVPSVCLSTLLMLIVFSTSYFISQRRLNGSHDTH